MISRQAKPAILLIHGAWHQPKHYEKFVNQLVSLGYVVDCPRLESCNNVIPPNKTLDDDVAQIRSIAEAHLESGSDIVAVTHSYGGVVGTTALTGLGSKGSSSASVRRLVFIGAFVPFESESLAGIFGGTLPPWLTPKDDELIHIEDPAGHFYSDMTVEEQKKAIDLLVVHPTMTQFESVQRDKLKSLPAAWRDIPVTYLFLKGDQALPFPVQEMMVNRVQERVDLKVERESCDASHSPFLSMPEELARIVNRIASTEQDGIVTRRNGISIYALGSQLISDIVYANTGIKLW